MQPFEIINLNKLIIKGYYHQAQSLKNSNTSTIIFVHGFRGRMSQKFINISCEYLSKCNINVVKFDATNHIGESGGTLFNFTISDFIEDLSFVIKYCVSNLGSKKIILIGHSLGGLVALYNSKNPYIKSLILLSPSLQHSPVGFLSHKGYINHDINNAIHFKYKLENGFDIYYDLSWNTQLDYLKFSQSNTNIYLKNNLINKSFIYFEKDNIIAKENIEKFYNITSAPKTFNIINNAPHNPKNKDQILDLINVLKEVSL